MEKIDVISLWPNLARAYEVAKAGNFSIKVIYYSDYVLSGDDDYKIIKEFYNDVTFSSDGEITQEIIRPNNYFHNNKNTETLEIISLRAEEIKNNIIPLEKNKSSLALIETAIKRLNLSIKDINNIEKISTTIAKLDKSNIIDAFHTAEAIQYVTPIANDDNYIVAENNIINFGNKIKIIKGNINLDNIESAINYLNELKKST